MGNMPLDQVEEEHNNDSDSSTEQLGRSVELKMPSPTLSASSPENEDDDENKSVGGDEITPPPLKPTDSWEDSNEDNETSDGINKNVVSSVLVRKVDSFLAFWNEWSASSLRTDQGLKLLQWSFWAASRVAAPGPPVPGHRGNFNRRYLNPELSPALRKMYFDLSLVRYCLRLYGLPSSIEAIRNGTWGAGWDDPRIHKLGKVMAWSMALYYPLEHVAFTGWVVPKLSRQYVDANRWSAISCRFWVTYIAADLASSVLKLKELKKRREAVARDVQTGVILEDEVSYRSVIYLIFFWKHIVYPLTSALSSLSFSFRS